MIEMADIAKELQKLKALVNQRQTTAIFSNKSNESTKLALGDAELYINDMTRKFSFTRAGVKNPIMIDAKTRAIENVEYLNGCRVEELEGLYEDVEQLKYDMEHHKHELMDYDVKMTEGLAVGGIPDIGFSLLDTSIWGLTWQTWGHKLNIVIDRCERDITTDHIFCFNISFHYNEVIHTISCEHDFSQYETIPTGYINLTLQSTIGVGNALMSCSNGYWITFSVNIAEEDESKISDFVEDESIKSPTESTAQDILKTQLLQVIETLTPREQKVIRLRYGIDDNHSRTLEEVGKEFNVTRERIRQIEAKALRKLRHPNRSKKLQDFYE